MSAIPMGIIARTVRALVADILSQDFVQALRAKGMREWPVFKHVVRNAAPTALAVMGLQFGYLLGGSILIETVFAWPGTGFLLNTAIFQRDLPLLQGTILVLALFFVVAQPDRRRAAIGDRPAHPARLTRWPSSRPDAIAASAPGRRSQGYWASVGCAPDARPGGDGGARRAFSRSCLRRSSRPISRRPIRCADRWCIG